MKKVVLFLALSLLSTGAMAAPTCVMCQGLECWNSIMYPYNSCIATQSNCYAFDDCEYRLADGRSCKDRLVLQLARSETFTGQKDATRVDWRLTNGSARPAAVVATR